MKNGPNGLIKHPEESFVFFYNCNTGPILFFRLPLIKLKSHPWIFLLFQFQDVLFWWTKVPPRLDRWLYETMETPLVYWGCWAPGLVWTRSSGDAVPEKNSTDRYWGKHCEQSHAEGQFGLRFSKPTGLKKKKKGQRCCFIPLFLESKKRNERWNTNVAWLFRSTFSN